MALQNSERQTCMANFTTSVTTDPNSSGDSWDTSLISQRMMVIWNLLDVARLKMQWYGLANRRRIPRTVRQRTSKRDLGVAVRLGMEYT